MDVLLGIWPDRAGSGVVGIWKVVPAPSMIPAEGALFIVTELDGRGLVIMSKLPSQSEDVECEIRCVADPDDIRRLLALESDWKSVDAEPCVHCQYQ